MNNIFLKDFQKKAIDDLKIAFETNYRNIVLESCTGSGKTIILTNFIDKILDYKKNLVFVWLTPGQGELEEQSKKKMDKYVPNRKTRLLSDVMLNGFSAGETCFINWELLNNKNNIAVQEGDFTNIYQYIKNAHNNGLSFVVIIDEEHLNQTPKSKEIIDLLNPYKIIKASATPTLEGEYYLVSIDEADVINEELIKKKIIINLGIGENIRVDNENDFLLERAINKRDELELYYNKEADEDINPLIVVQLPNEKPKLVEEVEKFFIRNSITYDNGKLAVWLTDKKINNVNIEDNSNRVEVLLFKQAISTGWDCPRAQILVKLRDKGSETFEIQTIGRIRRMPEAHFYNTDALNYSYLYTFHDSYISKIKEKEKNVYESRILKLKKEIENYNFKIYKELKSQINIGLDSKTIWNNWSKYLKTKYCLDTKYKTNRIKLETNGYIFDKDIIKNFYVGEVTLLNAEEFKRLRQNNLVEPLDTTVHGQTFQHIINELANLAHIQYDEMRVIIRRLFDAKVRDEKCKVLSLEPKELYSFFINNFKRIKIDLDETLSDINLIAMNVSILKTKEELFKFPEEYIFSYDASKKIQKVYSKNIYEGYLSSAEPRSLSEARFEKYCEQNDNVKWFYKNGDKGMEYLSIVYYDSIGKQKLFYPDYVVIDKNEEMWVIETKGGFSKSGKSEDIDDFSPAKFDVLKKYLEKHELFGGFVRLDKNCDELFICQKEYSNNINSEEWVLLSEVL